MPPQKPAKKSAINAEARRTNVLLEAIQKDIKVFMEDQRSLRAEFNTFKVVLDEIDKRLERVELHLSAVERRLTDVEVRLGRLEERLTTVESRPS